MPVEAKWLQNSTWHVSRLHSRPNPGVFYTHFYTVNMTVVSALKNCHIWSFPEVPMDFLNHFWIQVAVSEVKRRCVAVSEVKRLKIYNGCVTEIHQRTKVSVRV